MNEKTTAESVAQEDQSDEVGVSSSDEDFEHHWKDEERRAVDLLLKHGIVEGRIEQGHWYRIFQLAHLFQALDTHQCDWVDGVAPFEAIEHEFRLPNAVLAGLFVKEVLVAQPGSSASSVEKMVESLSDYRVLLRQSLQVNAMAMTEAMLALDEVARIYGGHYEGWESLAPREQRQMFKAPDPAEVAQAEARRAERRFRMRTEYLGDILISRLTLAPYVVSWKDCDDLADYTQGTKTAACSGFGHEVDFEVCEGGPSLDEMRWLLWQVTDLHVAAQSLNYAEKYTGERLDHRLMDRLTVSASSATELQRRQGLIESQIEVFKSSRKPLLERLQSVTGIELEVEE